VRGWGTIKSTSIFPLPRTARLLVSRLPVKIVALGSSSTYGVGASTSAASYPSRLAEELVRRFPGQKFHRLETVA